MEYTTDKLCKLAGVTSRTLRHYHKIGLLVPVRTSTSGYRIYGQREVDRLQQILFYRELGVELSQIAAILDAPSFDPLAALEGHRNALLARRDALDALIATVSHTIDSQKGERSMSDQDKFQGFKQRLVEENEAKYGQEIREKYGEDAVAASNARMMNLTQAEYQRMQDLGEQILAALRTGVQQGQDPKGPEGRAVAELHKQWLGLTWGSYSPEAHRGLVDMYVADPRFTAYYDSQVPGCAAFLRDAVHAAV